MTQAFARVIADSISPEGKRITTFHTRYWRPIHSELMTHRVFSRNAGSSRARPSKAIIEQVRTDPWGPIHWGANQPGMQAHGELDELSISHAKTCWKMAAEEAANRATHLTEIGAHKQIVNRILEPFTYIDVLITSTEYANWFALRDHPDAQPEIQELARVMRAALDASTPELLRPGEWHLPYVADDDWIDAHYEFGTGREEHQLVLDRLKRLSVSRCAKISYTAFDGTVEPIEKELARYTRLIESQPMHSSPAEHQATPDDKDEHGNWRNVSLHGNLRGFVQYRKTLPNEFVSG